MKSVAYTVYQLDNGKFGVACCVLGERGFHPVSDYGPYVDEERPHGIAERLNARLGVDTNDAHRIVASTMIPKKRKVGAK